MAIHSPRHTRRLYSAANDDTHGTSPADDVPLDTLPAESAATPPEMGAVVPLSSAEEAAAVLATCLELMRERRLDELVSYVPDEVIDRCLQRRKLR